MSRHILRRVKRWWSVRRILRRARNTSSPRPLPVPSDDEVYRFLERALARMLVRTDVPWQRGERGRLYGWYWGYYGRACLDMYRAGGGERFLELCRSTCWRLIDERDDRLGLVDDARGKVLPSWGTRFEDGARANEITVAGLVTMPMAELALATDDSRLAEAVFETLSCLVAEGEHYGDALFYRHPSDGMVEALNHAALYGAALAHASRLPGAPSTFAPAALGLNRYFQRRCQPAAGGGLAWPYRPAPGDPADLPSEPIWKAGATIELPIALAEAGLLADPTMLKRIALSITGSPVTRIGRVPSHIGKDRVRPMGELYVGTSKPGFLASWLQIDDPALRTTILRLMALNNDRFPNGWLGGARPMIMGFAHLRAQGHAHSLERPS